MSGAGASAAAPDCRTARALFPRGLAQPEGSFRFSADALLLAAFAGRPADRGGPVEVLDLGAGCGAVGLAVLLADPDNPSLRVTGLDIQADCLEAAADNAAALGFADRFRTVCLDVRDVKAGPRPVLAPESFDLVLANPPYREPGRGRMASGAKRAAALFETAASLDEFLAGAAFALKNRSRLRCVFLAERLAGLVAALRANSLEPKTILPVHSRAGEPARLVLVEAVKHGRTGLTLASPLFLYEGSGDATRVTDQALAFCPFLRCNGKRSR